MSRLRIALTLLLAVAALGWNPVEYRPGPALRWLTSAPVVWNPDGGPLGSLDNLEATAMVQTGFDIWQVQPTATIEFARGSTIENGDGIAVDVTAANIIEILDLDNGQNPVIYDNDQEIWAALGVSTSVLGFAGELRATGSTITKGFIALQGDWVDGVEIRPPDCGAARCDPELPAFELFLNIVVHEIGHFVGLGHSSVNHESEGIAGCPEPGIEYFATMSPLAHYAMETLHYDDVIGLSTLYPASVYASGSVGMRGTLFDRDGTTPFDGANVVVRPDTTDCDLLYGRAQATQSGVNPFENGGAGSYVFGGLDPASGYTLFVTEIDDGGGYPIGGSTPPSLVGPPEYFNGSDEASFDPPDLPDDREPVVTGSTGTEIAGLDILINNAGDPGSLPGSGADALRLLKTASGSIRLTWGAVCNTQQVPDQDFAVYGGTLETIGGVQDHTPVTCGTAGAFSYELPPEGGNRYFMVAPLLAGREGELGTGTAERTRVPLETCGEVRPGACP